MLLFTLAAVFFGLYTVRGTSVLPGDKAILVGCPFHEGTLGQALQVIEPFVDHIPHAIGEMIPVASVDQHALPALAVVGTLLGAAAIICTPLFRIDDAQRLRILSNSSSVLMFETIRIRSGCFILKPFALHRPGRTRRRLSPFSICRSRIGAISFL